MKTFVLPMTRSHQRTILTLRQDGNEAETQTRGSSCWILKVRMDLWINEMTTKKQRKLVTGCTKIMQQQEMSTQEFIFEIKFDKDRNNNSKDKYMIFCRVDLETAEKYYHFATTTSASSSSSWWQPSDSWWTAWT